MSNVSSLSSHFSQKRYDLVESAFRAALAEPIASADLLLTAVRGHARAPGSKKARLHAVAEAAERPFQDRPSSRESVCSAGRS